MQNKSQRGSLNILIFIALVQGFDVIVHVVSNQLEPLRILASIILLTVLIASRFMTEKLGSRALLLSGGTYLMLNVFFLLENGLTNSGSGEPRVLLFLIVTATAVLNVFYGRSLMVVGSR